VIIKSLDELQVYQLGLAAADEISAILERPCFRRDFELRKQLADCSASVAPRIGEGFGQGTDRHCAHYQRLARGSCNEMCGHLSVAFGRREFRVFCANVVLLGRRHEIGLQERVTALPSRQCPDANPQSQAGWYANARPTIA
jgi:four helix bundle protein